MPEFTRAQVIQLFVLILAVPMQYILTRQSSEGTRIFEINRVIKGLLYFKQTYLDINSWLSWCYGENLGPSLSADGHSLVNTINKSDFFAGSDQPRTPRSNHVALRVGQVVRHRKYGYRGVIVGWDETPKTPLDWFNDFYGANEKWKEMPFYAVLVDTRDRLAPQMVYIVQEDLEVIVNLKVFHPLTDHYFENYDGAQFLPRPWLRKVYPHD